MNIYIEIKDIEKSRISLLARREELINRREINNYVISKYEKDNQIIDDEIYAIDKKLKKKED